MENNSTSEKILLVFNRNTELLRLVGATFYFKVASLRRMMKKNLIILKSLQIRKLLLMTIFCFICFVVVKYQLKVFGTYLYAQWTQLLQCCIWNFSQYYNNLYFYWTITNWNFIWNIVFSNGIYWDLRNKSVCLNTV